MFTTEEIGRILEKSAMVSNHMATPENLYAPIDYMLAIGGKRVRPRICLIVYNLFSDNIGREVIFPALALEVFHEFTLIHDDIMDEADTRRGQPTVHRKWNENIAILSGDAMSILAYKYIAEAPKEYLSQLLDLFTKTAMEVCEGQQYDMDFEDLPFITMEDYMSMIGLKTAVLIACSAKMGAIMAGRSAQECDAIYNYGYQLGIAFQITDDYLDTFGNEKIFGKRIGGDIANNKKTWLLVETFKRASAQDKEVLEKIMALGEDSFDEKVAAMKDLYIRLGIKESAEKTIDEYYRKAMDALAPANLDEPQTQRLGFVANMLIHREK